MKNALGLTPKHDPFIKSSRLCGSCHVVNLPNVDQPVPSDQRTMLDDLPNSSLFRPFKHTIEQATYLEWLNSAYQDEYPAFNKTPGHAQSCQGCHMPEGFTSADGKIHVDRLQGASPPFRTIPIRRQIIWSRPTASTSAIARKASAVTSFVD